MRVHILRSLSVLIIVALASTAGAQVIPLVNPDFELDVAVTSPPSGWIASAGTMYVTSGSGLSPVDPTSAFSGTNFLTANRLAPNPDATFPSASQTMSIFQSVDVSAFSSAIDVGDRYVDLSFAYNAADPDDLGVVTMSFFDGATSPLGTPVSFDTSSASTSSGQWSTTSLFGQVPSGARSIQFSLAGQSVGGGSARNVSFDNLSALLTSAQVITPRDVVHGNLVQFSDNGAWSWFQDERAIVDQQHGSLVVGYMVNRGGVGGEAVDGQVTTTHFDLATGRRTSFVHNDLESYGGGDDHNVPGLLVKGDGDILAIYAAHNNLNGTEDDRSYYRTYNVNSDTWGAESEYHWWDVIPSNAPGAGGTTYSNVFQLSAEDPDGDGNGRLYNIARTQQSPHIMFSDDNGATWEYGGQLTKQASNPPSSSYVNGYYKYSSNGVDRIDFIATEFHPRDYNNSIYHAYIQNGKLYDSAGNEVDGDIFDAASSFDPSSVKSTDDFTQVFQAGTSSNSRAWTTDIQRYDDGSIIALFKARAGGFGSHTSGANDHRVWYSRFDPNTGQWTNHEIAKAGGALFSGQETDYTGLGAIHPNDPSTIYISTEIDPTTDEALNHHEIYKGVTSDNGASWTWTAITENSSYDNLRPIIPSWDEENTAVLWWRGTMSSSQNYDTAVVGILDRNSEQLGLMNYFDASPANTSLTDNSPLSFTGPAATAGAADGSWHQRTGVGNEGTVFTADESGAESVPTLKTTVDNLTTGTYDVFAFFWSNINQDWQIEAGLSEDDLMLFRPRGSQQADAEQFEVAPVVDEGNRSLYRAYLGRVNLADVGSLDVFVNDSTGGAGESVWYDGVGLAQVLSAGDFDGDGDVDGQDFLHWQRGQSPSALSAADLASWQSNYSGDQMLANPLAVPEPASLTLVGLSVLTLVCGRP